MKPQKRLEFEENLLAEIAAPRKGSRRSMPSVLWMFFVVNVLVWLSALMLAAGPGGSAFTFGTASRLSRMATTFVQCLQQNAPEMALQTVTLAGGSGRAAVQAENQRVYRMEESSGLQEESSAELQQALLEMYADLARQGLDWSQAKPLAFVGFSAKARHPVKMKRSIRIVTGEIFLTCGRDLYAVEVSVRCPGKDCYISDIWSWRRVGGIPSDLKTFAQSRLASMEQEQTDDDLGVKLSWVRRLVVLL